MTDAPHKDIAEPVPALSVGGQPLAFDEALGALSAALGADWAVEQETDCDGEVSIVTFPLVEAWGAASFILFERSGERRVAMVRRDIWEWDRGFTTLGDAVDALIATARGGNTEALEQTSRLAVIAA